MKKRIPSYFAGFLTAALIFALMTSAMAATGQVSFSNVNISVLGSEKIASGDTYTGENGAQIPSSITYTDEKGGKTTFVALREMSDLLNSTISWDGKTQTVHFGEGEDNSANSVEILTGQNEVNADSTQIASEPELNVTHGLFTEIAPLADDAKSKPIVLLNNADFCSSTGFTNQLFHIYPMYGNYVEIEVTNHGEPVAMQVGNPYYVTTDLPANSSQFTMVRLDKGQSIVRAFSMSDVDDYPRNILWMNIESIFEGGAYNSADITVTVTQYTV